MKKQIFLPVYAIVGGLIGFLWRRWELMTAFEKNGLHISGAVSTTALVAVTIVYALLALLLTRMDAGVLAAGGFAQFQYLGKKVPYMAEIIGAGAIGLSGILEILNAPYYELVDAGGEPVKAIIPILVGMFCIFAAAALVTIAARMFSGEGKMQYLGRLLLPAFMCCFWLIYDYQKFAGNPTALDYVYRLFAIMCILLALYYRCAFSMEQPKPLRFTFFAIMGVYFSMLTFADDLTLAARLRFAAMTVMLLIDLWALYRNRAIPKAPETITPEPVLFDDEDTISLTDILNEYKGEHFDE